MNKTKDFALHLTTCSLHVIEGRATPVEVVNALINALHTVSSESGLQQDVANALYRMAGDLEDEIKDDKDQIVIQ